MHSTDVIKKRVRNVLNISDVCALIKQCSESGVKEITLGELHISFASKAIEALPEQAIAGTETPQTLERSIDSKELEVKQEQLDFMIAEDPVAYERLMIAGELEDGNSRT